MRVVGPIIALVVVTCLAYTCVGRLVPQVEQHPPVSAGAGASPDDLANAGREIYTGSCAQCHGALGAGGGRGPDLDGVASRAPSRAEERTKETGTPYTADDYLGESLKDPGAYLVKHDTGEPYGNIMSFKLQPAQTLAVFAFLQSLGGTPTISAESELWKKWGQPIETEEEGAEGGGGGAAKPIPQGPPDEMVKKYGCVGCHDFEGETYKSGGGPPLSKVGARMSPGDILTQIIMPDSAIAEAPPGTTFAKGLMRSTLEGNAFYSEVGQEDMQKLVLWLSEKKGQ